MITAEALQQNLAHCTGTEQWYRHPLGITYTDGIKILTEDAQCMWLVDAITSHQKSYQIIYNPDLQEFQLWLLKVNEDRSAILACYEDSPSTCEPAISQLIPSTDFPMQEIKLYMEQGTLLLPSEH
ncbi:hypothetical protein C1752_17193 [Acaryochloris thomasi RCC1774]|uniref:DUF6876 domain-containing protein n=1 Tax=Acaryochloris thomasi RCC1774 TaxID=1764569 RepID=A0A2W1J7F9_9CYAN|nr:DUF6876 family protein [Acaryochloris thomasi]PZD70178.1 hypothetical protein C1752_17193 [Acaryochloris thomasi RCC1774]